MKKSLAILAICLCLAALGCGGSGGGGVSQPAVGGMKITNYMLSYEITAIYIRPSGSSDWGFNKISGSPLGYEDEYSTSDLTPGNYDCRIVRDDALTYSSYNMDISAGTTRIWNVVEAWF